MTAAMFQTMQDILADQKQNPLSVDDVTAVIAGRIRQFVPMNEETNDQFQKFMKKIM